MRRARRLIAPLVVVSFSMVMLTSCSISAPIAFRVTEHSVNLAFCEEFDAASVEFEYSNYPGPFQGPMYRVGFRAFSGESRHFGDGKPVLRSIVPWSALPESGDIPENWERLDVSFYDEAHNYVAGFLLFSREVQSQEWAWQSDSSVSKPTCELQPKA